MLDLNTVIAQALQDPNLAKPGGCQYVKNGKRCIVGTVLHLAGVSDETLRGPVRDGRNDNLQILRGRRDLVEIADTAFFESDAVDILAQAQFAWDHPTHPNPCASISRVLQKRLDTDSWPEVQ